MDKAMTKGLIYYTANTVEEPIFSAVQKQLKKPGLPITSVSLKPIDFGTNFVIEAVPSYPTMVRQILKGLQESKEDIVFFVENDVLYHPSHFDFVPEKKDIYYYNLNNWRWDYPKDRLIGYDGLTSLSQICAYRETLLNHYERRWARIVKEDLVNSNSRDPEWARVWGYEPGTKKPRNGGFSDEQCDHWYSEFPNIDIRHHRTFSNPKTKLEHFRRQPTGWEEITLAQLDGWELKDVI